MYHGILARSPHYGEITAYRCRKFTILKLPNNFGSGTVDLLLKSKHRSLMKNNSFFQFEKKITDELLDGLGHQESVE